MIDDKDSEPGKLPETKAEAKIRQDAEHTKKLLDQLKIENADSDGAKRSPMNKNNAIERIFGNKPKPLAEPE